MHNHKLTKYAAAAAAALAMAACGSDGTSTSGSATPDTTPPTTTPAKNVVFFLGDGMGMTTMTAARIYKVGEDGELTMDTLPETGFVRTYSNNAQVTDSAPSMSAYMTGVKMNNEVISMSADTMAYDAGGKDYLSGADSTCPSGNGKPVTTLLELMKAAGYGTGVVTTTRITHATPAATYSHICHRDGENTIAAQLTPAGKGFNAALGDGVDVVFGGGRKHFQPTTAGGARTDGRDLIAELKAGGYRYASNKAEFDTLQPTDGKVVGLFTSSHMSYDLDRDPSKEPSLGEMTNKPVTQPMLSSGLRMDGLGTVLGGVFNTFPYTSFSQNVGLVGVTGIRSRFVCVAGGAIMVVLGLIPKMGALVEALPTVVLGGAGLVMFGMVAATGIRILTAVDFKKSRNNLFVVGISVGFGMIPVVAPDFHMWLPKSIGPLIDSGILLASISSVVLNLVFNGATGDAEGLREAAMAAEA